MRVHLPSFFVQFISWLMCLLLFTGCLYVTISPHFKVNYIDCRLSSGEPCLPNIYAKLEPYKYKPMLLLNTRQIQQKLIRDFPYLNNAHISVIWPQSIQITLDAKPVVVKVINQAGTLQHNLTLDGYLTPIVNVPDSLPVIYLTDSFPPEFTVPLQCILLVNLLQKNGLVYVKVELTDNETITLELSNHLKVLISPKDEPQLVLATLQAILSAAKINPEVNVIDMRFSKPVLKSDQLVNIPEASQGGELGE